MTGGDSIGGRAEELRSVAGSVPSGLAAEVAEAAEQIRDQLADIIGDGSVEVVGLAQQQVEEANGLFRTLVALREALHSVSGYHSGVAPAGGSGGSGPGPAPSAPVTPPPVTAPDGSQYPAAAGWIAAELPRRVRENEGDRTTGYVDGSLSSYFRSGTDGTWSPYIQERGAQLGLPSRIVRRLSSHVEMKVAAMMVQRGQQHSELVINHVPCGSQPQQRPGCHQAVEQFLPDGHTLTVHGTTQQGAPYSHTYRGKA